MRRRQTSGQILILIVLVLIGLIVIFVLFSRPSARVRVAPVVQEAIWTVDDSAVSTVSLGQEVTARVTVKAVEEYVGSIVVKIRKDVSHLPDSDFHMSTIPVNLNAGDSKEIDIAFTPDEASSSGFFGLRGYFIEIDFQVTSTTWVMENSYPPRLTVTA